MILLQNVFYCLLCISGEKYDSRECKKEIKCENIKIMHLLCPELFWSFHFFFFLIGIEEKNIKRRKDTREGRDTREREETREGWEVLSTKTKTE